MPSPAEELLELLPRLIELQKRINYKATLEYHEYNLDEVEKKIALLPEAYQDGVAYVALGVSLIRKGLAVCPEVLAYARHLVLTESTLL